MPHSFVRQFLAAVFAAAMLSVPTDSLAQASPYPVSRSRPFRVVPAGTLLEIDRALSKDPVKQGLAMVSFWPEHGFHVAAESKTKLVGRFSRAVMLRLSTEGVRIIERDEEIAKMAILHFEPAIENAMMGGAFQQQRINDADFSAPPPQLIVPPRVELRPESKKK